jgi:hypothetical protein
MLKIKDTVPVEEDLKFTDETIEDVIGHKVNYDSPEQEKVSMGRNKQERTFLSDQP